MYEEFWTDSLSLNKFLQQMSKMKRKEKKLA